MSREIDLSKGLDSLSEEDLRYLRDRSRLTPEQEASLLPNDKPSAPEAPPLETVVNTGDTGPEEPEEDEDEDLPSRPRRTTRKAR